MSAGRMEADSPDARAGGCLRLARGLPPELVEGRCKGRDRRDKEA